jgi:hypothetical protein
MRIFKGFTQGQECPNDRLGFIHFSQWLVVVVIHHHLLVSFFEKGHHQKIFFFLKYYIMVFGKYIFNFTTNKKASGADVLNNAISSEWK